MQTDVKINLQKSAQLGWCWEWRERLFPAFGIYMMNSRMCYLSWQNGIGRNVRGDLCINEHQSKR